MVGTIEKPDTESSLKLDNSFPESVIMIHLGAGRYAAYHFTTQGSDPMEVDCLVCFKSSDQASFWEAAYGKGEQVTKTFDEAREIDINKPKIHGLALIEDLKVFDIHFVR